MRPVSKEYVDRRIQETWRKAKATDAPETILETLHNFKKNLQNPESPADVHRIDMGLDDIIAILD